MGFPGGDAEGGEVVEGLFEVEIGNDVVDGCSVFSCGWGYR